MMDGKPEVEATGFLIILCIYAEAAPSSQMIPLKQGPALSGFLPLKVQTNLRFAQLSSHQTFCSTSLR